MSDKSPLFISALELLAHSTELYAAGQPRKYKFVVLHLANAIELILKDCMIDHSISIYKNPNETVSIWTSIQELSKLNINIPEKPIIELLVDDRNTIQHRFGFPNAEAVYFYLEQVVAFFTRFLSEQYGVKLSESLAPYLSKENLALIGLSQNQHNQLVKLMQVSPESAVLQAYSAIEEEIRSSKISLNSESDQEKFLRLPDYLRFLNVLVSNGYLAPQAKEKFSLLREARNIAAHFAPGYSEKVDWKATFEIALQILTAIEKAKKDGIV